MILINTFGQLSEIPVLDEEIYGTKATPERRTNEKLRKTITGKTSKKIFIKRPQFFHGKILNKYF